MKFSSFCFFAFFSQSDTKPSGYSDLPAPLQAAIVANIPLKERYGIASTDKESHAASNDDLFDDHATAFSREILSCNDQKFAKNFYQSVVLEKQSTVPGYLSQDTNNECLGALNNICTKSRRKGIVAIKVESENFEEVVSSLSDCNLDLTVNGDPIESQWISFDKFTNIRALTVNGSGLNEVAATEKSRSNSRYYRGIFKKQHPS